MTALTVNMNKKSVSKSVSGICRKCLELAGIFQNTLHAFCRWFFFLGMSKQSVVDTDYTSDSKYGTIKEMLDSQKLDHARTKQLAKDSKNSTFVQ